MRYDLSEIVNDAIQSNTPVVLLEGKDDESIYERIANAAERDVVFYQIANIEEYSAGCKDVIQAIYRLQPKFEEREDNIRRILGIIDRDIRFLKTLWEDEIDYKILKGLFILKHYSIETYFATRNNLKKAINKVTYAPQSIISETILNFVEQNHWDSSDELYYLSLEALKNACEMDYTACISYQSGEIKENTQRNHLYQQVISKIDSLDTFAINMNISRSNIKAIVKGKWYLYSYLYKALHQIKNLENHCNSQKLCQSCNVNNTEDCSFKFKPVYNNVSTLYESIFEYVDIIECEDIISAFQRLN